ncbi:MAG: endo alpha-1,4 polygalactosaminidase [Promethearchaeota archaeon]
MKRPAKAILVVVLVSVPVAVWFFHLRGSDETKDGERDYRQEMRFFVQNISAYARDVAPGFVVIPQNGHQLLTLDGEAQGPVASEYIAAIDGVGREDLFYGYDADDRRTPDGTSAEMSAFMDLALGVGLAVLVTDYCSRPSNVDDSYARNAAVGYTSFAADHRELDDVPAYPDQPHNASTSDVTSLDRARNFLYLINPSEFSSKAAFLSALSQTDYDLLIIDLFFNGTALTTADVGQLKTKASGGERLVVCYASIGEAEDYRYYWQDSWKANPPAWLAAENPNWPGNYKVRYWNPGWQAVVFGSSGAYIDRAIAAGFDGVYLDIIDAFEYFEGQ